MRIVDYNMATFRLFNCGEYRGRHHATPAAAAAAAPIMTAPRLPPRAATGGGREMIGTSAPGISASWPLLATMHDLCRHAQRCSGGGSIIYWCRKHNLRIIHRTGWWLLMLCPTDGGRVGQEISPFKSFLACSCHKSCASISYFSDLSSSSFTINPCSWRKIWRIDIPLASSSSSHWQLNFRLI